MHRWRVGEDRGSKERDRCPLTLVAQLMILEMRAVANSALPLLPHSYSPKKGQKTDPPPPRPRQQRDPIRGGGIAPTTQGPSSLRSGSQKRRGPPHLTSATSRTLCHRTHGTPRPLSTTPGPLRGWTSSTPNPAQPPGGQASALVAVEDTHPERRSGHLNVTPRQSTPTPRPL
jgi:hypothetical protein